MAQEERLRDVISRLANAGIVTSVFIDARHRSKRRRGSAPASVKSHRPLTLTPFMIRAVTTSTGCADRTRQDQGRPGHSPPGHALQRRACPELLQRSTGCCWMVFANCILDMPLSVVPFFVGLREAVREMKALMRAAAMDGE